VHALDRADALGEVEDLRLAEGRQREEARLDVEGAVGTHGALALPHDRRVEALLDDRPHREARGEDLVAVLVADDEVRSVAGAELVDVAEQVVRGIAGEDVGQARLDADAHEREPAVGLPPGRLRQLVVAELDPDLRVGLARVPARQAHRHVEVVGAGGAGPLEDRQHEARVDGVEDVRGTHLTGQRLDRTGIRGVDAGRPEA
jgi:hypothetical protein